MSFSSPLFRYEDEINKRTECENEFVLIKKVCRLFVTQINEVLLLLNASI